MRRLAMVLALLSSGVIAFVAPSPVRADVIAVEPELIAHIFDTQTSGPSGYPFPNNVMPWGLDRLDARIAANYGRDNSYTYTSSNTGTGVKVYVVDTGVKANHTDLGGRVVDGWSYRAVSSAKSLEWFTALGSCKTNTANYEYKPLEHPFDVDEYDSAYISGDKGGSDNNGHGTHVAGTVGGITTGVAKGVTIVPVRVLNSCGRGTATMVRTGLEWIRDNHIAGERAVVNMSIGFDEVSTEIDNVVIDLIALGIPVIAAAGNSATTSCNTTPAGTLGTFSIGASTYIDTEASFSNFGECVDLFAPGFDILSSWPMSNPTTTSVIEASDFQREYGTSMAAPHVAGVVARYLQGKTTTSSTPSETWNWLKLNATCNAITYFTPTSGPSRVGLPKTPNRLLAIEAPATVPCAPASVTATAGTRTVTVTWNPVASDNGSATLDYTVTLVPGNQTCTKTPIQTLSCSFSGLLNGTTYTATVRAVNGVGAGVVASTTATTTSGVPNAVTTLIGAVNVNSLDVSWVQGLGDGDGITYTATATPGNFTCTSTSTGCSITGLTLGTEYTVTVVGTNALGTGASASIVVSFVRPPLAVTDLAASVVLNDLKVDWKQGTGDSSGITYTATALPGGAKCTSTSTTCSISGLTVGTEYTITVVGVNTTGTGTGASIVKTFSRAPLAVTKLTATSADHALAISWEQGSGEGTGVTYTATATPGDLTCTSTSTSCSITALTNGVEYSISVIGVNKYGAGSAATIKATPDGIPEVPVQVQSVVNKRTITLSWPAVPSATNVTYVVSSRPGDLMCTTTLTTCEVTGLSYGVDYSFVITTRSSSGLTSSAALAGSVRPGFKVKKTTVKRGSSTLVTSFISSISSGKKTWSETGPCSIRGTRLVAPKKVTTCVLVLKVAKKGSYPAMSTRLKVSVKK